MSLDLAQLGKEFPYLITVPESRDRGATAFRFKLPVFPFGREFQWAELFLPRGFPEHATAKIILSQDAVLRIPHVEDSGALCIDGDPGPARGYIADDRIRLLLLAYQERFLDPWLAGELDGDFEKESLNYWVIKVDRDRSPRDPVRGIWTVDEHPSRPAVKEGLLLLPAQIVIAASDEHPMTNQVINSFGANAAQRIRVLVADIPISHAFTPSSWPRSAADIDRLLNVRLHADLRDQFRRQPRRRAVHRIVLLRNATCGFAYLLPGGPATVVGARKRAYPTLTTPLPLRVTRLDPSWTVGRDQHPEVAHRQEQHVLVLGAGALGSPVVDHLAKAGVGFITLVDKDKLVAANLGRHLLGAESIGKPKAESIARRINQAYPATVVTPGKCTAESWLRENTLSNVDLVLDLTGEHEVRWHVDCARQQHSCPLLIGWMEPFVAAAHVCSLPSGTPWMQGVTDPMGGLEAVTWPAEVTRQEPGCSSRFQSYTAAAAAHAVALVAESALKLIDGTAPGARVSSWVRGQRFLDEHWTGLELREWARPAAPHDGLVIERPFP